MQETKKKSKNSKMSQTIDGKGEWPNGKGDGSGSFDCIHTFETSFFCIYLSKKHAYKIY